MNKPMYSAFIHAQSSMQKNRLNYTKRPVFGGIFVIVWFHDIYLYIYLIYLSIEAAQF